MKKSYFIVFTFILFFACNSQKHKALTEISTLQLSVDSLLGLYQAIDWEYYKSIKKEIDDNQDFIAKNFEPINRLDTQLITYFGPYSAAGKLISRGFKKLSPKIEAELNYTKLQLSDLGHDIENNLIHDNDSILIYIKTEVQAISVMRNDIDNLNDLLCKQVQAYQLTHKKVDSVIYLYNKNQ
jgi:hypothetical protein